MQAELIYNPRGGQVVVRHELEDAVALLSRSGWSVTWQETNMPGEATELTRRAVERGARVVIAAGGDGTISEVANGLVNTDVALGVLPVGTSNTWALQMRIPCLNPILPGRQLVRIVADLEERISRPLPANYYRRVLLDAARVLLEGHTAAVDMGEVSGRCFLMWAGIGLDAATVKTISVQEKRALGTWAYILNALEQVRHYAGTDVRLKLDRREMEVNTPLIIVSNIQLYGGMVSIGARARVDDARLDVCIFKGDGFFTFVQHALNVLSRQHLRDPRVEYYQCSEIAIDAARPLPTHLDGEHFRETPVTIRNLPSALRVIVPRKVPQRLFCQPSLTTIY